MAHTLLLADPSLTIQRVVQLTFANEDIDVVVATDGADAMALAERLHPDVVLADVSLGLHSGYEVATFIRNHPQLAHVRVVLLCGAFERVNHGRASEIDCDLVLVKPFDPRQLLAQVKTLVDSGFRRVPPTPGPQAREVVLPPSAPLPAASVPFVRVKADTVKAYPADDRGPLVSPGSTLRPAASQPEHGRAGDRSASIDDAYDALMRQLSDPKPRASVVALRADDELLVERAVARVLERINPAVVREAMEDIITSQATRVIQEEIERVRRP